MSIPRPDINEESELEHRIVVRELGPIGFAQAWDDDEVVDMELPGRWRVPQMRPLSDFLNATPPDHTTVMPGWEFQLWEVYGLDRRYWAYRLVH